METRSHKTPTIGKCSPAKQCSEEPYAVMTARTDLWELWGSNHPEPPGHFARASHCRLDSTRQSGRIGEF